jgi:hypothetical protein
MKENGGDTLKKTYRPSRASFGTEPPCSGTPRYRRYHGAHSCSRSEGFVCQKQTHKRKKPMPSRLEIYGPPENAAGDSSHGSFGQWNLPNGITKSHVTGLPSRFPLYIGGPPSLTVSINHMANIFMQKIRYPGYRSRWGEYKIPVSCHRHRRPAFVKRRAIHAAL